MLLTIIFILNAAIHLRAIKAKLEPPVRKVYDEKNIRS